MIAKKLLYEDFTAFRGVCRSWRSVAFKDSFSPVQVPWLLLAPYKDDDEDLNSSRLLYKLMTEGGRVHTVPLPEARGLVMDDDTRSVQSDDRVNNSRDLYSLTKGGMVHTVHLPEARGKKLLTSLGWLITMDTYRGDMELLHPLSRARIPLPNVRSNSEFERGSYSVNHRSMFWAAALSASPSDTDDYTLMILVRPASLLAYWKPGNTAWVTLKTSQWWFSFVDLVYHSGQFYALSRPRKHEGNVFSIYPDPTTTTEVKVVGCLKSKELKGARGCYLAEAGGHLLVVVKKYLHDDDQRRYRVTVGLRTHYHHGTGDSKLTDKPIYNYMTTSFKVYRFESSNHKRWHLMSDLGGNSLFLGEGSAPVSFPCAVGAIKPDCIYFTDHTNLHYIRKDDRGRNRGRNGIEMGVYSLKEQRADTLYKGGTSRGRCFNCRPLWVIPSF